MVEKAEVSIIMGVYNAGDRDIFSEAVSSIRNQRFTDWEFLICDDGSDDDTLLWLQEIREQDDRIRILKNDRNTGLAGALNHCLKEAAGKYIARMDADDVSLPDRLEKEISFLDKHPEYQWVGTCVKLIDSSGEWGSRAMPEKPGKRDLLFRSPFVHPSTVFRREALESVQGYRVAKETRRTEDYDLFMRMYAKGMKGYNLQEELYLFREDRESLNRKKYRYRIDEAKVRWRGFCALKLMPVGILYVIKPLIVGLLPYPLLVRLRGDRKKRERASE